ncbi:MAG: PAS domain-containing sensor histidine kinase [Rhodospirillaceae bacterium]|nr:PAS domain-containing sensor histidine kinase [Rhodospirillaceae bacterium]
MEAIIQRIMDGIVIFNAKGEIDSCNPAAARVFGVKLDDMSGMTVAALIESDDGAVPPDLKLLAESGDSVEFRYGAGEDSADWIEAAAALLPLADETLLIGVFRDVSGRRRAEDEIRTLNENLEQRVAERTIQLRGANDNLQHALDNLRETQGQLVESEKMASLGGLVAGVAHEINTPLGICVTASSHLNDVSGKLAEKFKQGGMRRSDMESFLKVNDESNAIILTNLQRAANLVRSFKQVAVDQSSEERRRFGLAAYLDEVLISLRPYLKKGNHEVIVECDDSIEVDGYPGALSQIITNLVMNSLTHAYAEGVVGTLRMQAKKMEGDEIRLCYNDDGIGIPEDHIAKVFDPFFTTKRGSGGSGLGLNILYNLVTQKLGGRVKCESEPGEGATFIIKFPAQYMASSSNP